MGIGHWFALCSPKKLQAKKDIMPTNESKALQTLRGNIDWLKLDLQIIDVLCRKVIEDMKKYPVQEDHLSIALNVDSSKYEALNHPVCQSKIIFNQTINRRFEYAICQTYTFFTEYLHAILFEMYKHDRKKVLTTIMNGYENQDKANNVKMLSVYEIIKLGTYENIEKKIIDDIFRKLEDERSTKKLLQKILKCADLISKVDESIIEQTLQYLELRHLIIHHKSIVDEKYATIYGSLFTPQLVTGNKIPRTFETCKNSFENTLKLCKLIDKELIYGGFIATRK